MKNVIIFGSTGSVGENALDVIKNNRNAFRVKGLCVNRNIRRLTKQITEFSPRSVCVVDERAAGDAKGIVPRGVKFFSGEQGLEEFASQGADISLMAISGIASLKPLLTAIKHSRRVALANKESFVVAGGLVKRQAKKYNTELIPVDSEINALFQLFKKVEKRTVRQVHITASGGALYSFTSRQLRKVKAKQVLAHPTWNMGRRITVDSATLVNKGFEVVETHEFFDIPYAAINILLHRQSLMHAALEMKDGVVMSCFYEPDMRIPIEHALWYPGRGVLRKKGMFDTLKNFDCSFAPVDLKRFPLLRLVLEAARSGGNALTVVNAADEVAVEYFLKDKISFSNLYNTLVSVYTHRTRGTVGTFKDIVRWDAWARAKAKEYVEKRCC